MIEMAMTGESQERVTKLLEVAFAPQAARSLNRAAGTARAEMARILAAALDAPVAKVKAYLFIKAATPEVLEARITPKGYAGIPLIKLGATGPEPSRGKGRVRLKVNPVYIPALSNSSAFISTMRSGHRGVFVRRGKARLPITELRTTPIPDLFRKFRAQGIAKAAEALRTNLQADLKYALSKRAS